MDQSLFTNLFGRLLLVACPIVAFRFARQRSLKPLQCLLVCAAAGAVSTLLFVATIVFADMVYFTSPGAAMSATARGMAMNATFGLVFGAVCLWRHIASSSRLVMIGLAMIAAVDIYHLVVDPRFGLHPNRARPVMLMIALILGSLIYVWNPGAERELSVVKRQTEI